MNLDADLPIYNCLEDLKKQLRNNSVVVLEASPGAGKSTIVPLELIEEGFLDNKKILMLQPRRMAVKGVANRMAYLINESVGKRIGYSVRHEKKVSAETKIEVVTEGILLRMISNDIELRDIGLIIFDEFHERNIYSDITFAISRYIQDLIRPDLKILVMSASLLGNTRDYLSKFPFISSEGKQFPVKICYELEETEEPVFKKCARKIIEVSREKPGDILVFLPGEFEIKKTKELLLENNFNGEIHLLYGSLNYKEQEAALTPNKTGKRKVILSTPIAETSLTIEGIKVVIDSGLMKRIRYNAEIGISKLETVRISKDAAEQRAGRAGRMSAGECYRMWTNGRHLQLNSERKPEILDSDLATILLQLYGIGIKTFSELELIDQPPSGHFLAANQLLEKFNFIENGTLSSTGKKCLRFPSHPRLSKILIEAEKLDNDSKSKNNISLAIALIAVLEEKDSIQSGHTCDMRHILDELVKAEDKKYSKLSISTVKKIEIGIHYWRKLFHFNTDKVEINDLALNKLLLSSYFDRIAILKDPQELIYQLENGLLVILNPDDYLINERWLLILDIDTRQKPPRIKLAMRVNDEVIFPYIKKFQNIYFDEENEFIVSRLEYKFGNLLVKSTTGGEITNEDRYRLFKKQIERKGIECLNFSNQVENWLARLTCLRRWNPNENWPDFSNDFLFREIDSWLLPHLNEVNTWQQIKELPYLEIFKNTIGYEVSNKIELLAPEKILVPSGSKIHVNYFREGKDPEIKVRIQELFGWVETPKINGGKQSILIHLLSPGYKPVQITKDLKSFWKNLYPSIKKELVRKYPKHYWPDNPMEANAVRGTKKS